MRPPPSPWVETFISLLAFIAPEWGLFAPACVSAGGLCLAKGPIFGFVSASKISVPPWGGDGFDDWMVGLQFKRYCLHHLTLGLRPSSALSVYRARMGAFRAPPCLFVVLPDDLCHQIKSIEEVKSNKNPKKTPPIIDQIENTPMMPSNIVYNPRIPYLITTNRHMEESRAEPRAFSNSFCAPLIQKSK